MCFIITGLDTLLGSDHPNYKEAIFSSDPLVLPTPPNTCPTLASKELRATLPKNLVLPFLLLDTAPSSTPRRNGCPAVSSKHPPVSLRASVSLWRLSPDTSTQKQGCASWEPYFSRWLKLPHQATEV